jgi:hypothetical protein
MRSRSTLALLAGALMLSITTAPSAQTGSGSVLVRVNVVRSCHLQTMGDVPSGAVAITCSRGTAGVVATGTGSSMTRVTPLPARQTTVISMRAPLPEGLDGTGDAASTPDTAGSAAYEMITLNF